jgi:Ca2+-binding RTX toxin-like protein
VLTATGGGTVVVPFGAFLLTAGYERVGDDLLLIGKEGEPVVIIRGFFALEVPPNLATENGAVVEAALAIRLAGAQAPGQYAAASDGIEAQPIGRVTEIDGEATATRLDGTKVTLAKDSAVYQGDIIETASGAVLEVVFIDESSFSVGEDARMVLDELVFDPATLSGESSISVLQGVFVFVSGEIAANNPEQMMVKTPVATIGIRGTAVAVAAAQEGELNKIVLLTEQTPDGQITTGAVVVANEAGTIVLDEAFEATRLTSFTAAPSQPYIAPASEVGSLMATLGNLAPQSVQHLAPANANGQGQAAKDAADGRGATEGATADGAAPGEGEAAGAQAAGPEGEAPPAEAAPGEPPPEEAVLDDAALAEALTEAPPEGLPVEGPALAEGKPAPPPGEFERLFGGDAALSDTAAGFTGDFGDFQPFAGPGPGPQPPDADNILAEDAAYIFAEDAAYLGDLKFTFAAPPPDGAPRLALNDGALFVESPSYFGEAAFKFQGSLTFTASAALAPGVVDGPLGPLADGPAISEPIGTGPVADAPAAVGPLTAGPVTQTAGAPPPEYTPRGPITPTAGAPPPEYALKGPFTLTAAAPAPEAAPAASLSFKPSLGLPSFADYSFSGPTAAFAPGLPSFADYSFSGPTAAFAPAPIAAPSLGVPATTLVAALSDFGSTFFNKPFAALSDFGSTFFNKPFAPLSDFDFLNQPFAPFAPPPFSLLPPGAFLTPGSPGLPPPVPPPPPPAGATLLISLTDGNDVRIGSPLSDTISGLAGDDTLFGKDGDDVLFGGTGQDVLRGESGNDTLDSGPGVDLLDGGVGDDKYVIGDGVRLTFIIDGGGFDTLLFARDPTLFLFAQFDRDFPSDARAAFDGAGNLIIHADERDGPPFEIIIADQLQNSTVNAFDIKDIGFQRFVFSIDPTAGNDAVFVRVNGSTTNGLDGDDAIYAHGTFGGVTLRGDAGNDFLIGGFGSDRLEGGVGNDHLVGGEGFDNLLGGDGDDVLEGESMSGEAGNDTMIIGREDVAVGPSAPSGAFASGGTGFDKVLVEDGLGTPVALRRPLFGGELEAVFVRSDGSLFTAEMTGVERLLLFRGPGGALEDISLDGGGGTKGAAVIGTVAGEVLSGGIGNDLVFGNEGDDTLFGGLGDDHLSGGAANDRLDGGPGFDIADFGDASSGLGVVADLTSGVSFSNIFSGLGDDQLINIEGLRGTRFNDTLIGDDGDNLLDGGGGDDLMQGGPGFDRYVWRGFGGFSQGRIEDTLIGDEDDGANALRLGLQGDDTRLIDFVYTKIGTDLVIRHLLGNPATEALTIVNQFAGSGINSLETDELTEEDFGPSLKPLFVNGEIVFGTVNGSNVGEFMAEISGVGAALNGHEGDDVLIGNFGKDTLDGGPGDDLIAGGIGGDLMIGGTGDDFYLYFPGSSTTTTIQDKAGTDTLELGLKPAAFTARNNGADLFIDFVGVAIDELVLVNHLAGSPIEFLTIAGSDRLFLLATGPNGTIADDLISGNPLAETLQGDDGNDLIFGVAGNDVLLGGFGSDILIGGPGSDILTGNGPILVEADTFFYFSPADGATAAPGTAGLQTGDQITDFDAFDIFEFETSGFDFSPDSAGESPPFFTVAGFNGTNASTSGSGLPYFVFDPDSRTLYHDDGNNGGYTVIATVQAGATVEASDLRLVTFNASAGLF